MKAERLQKVLAHRGVASRRAAEQMILDGRVRVDGQVVRELGTRVDPDTARLEVDGQRVGAQPDQPVLILLNKPKGVVTTVSDPHAEQTVMDLVDLDGRRVYPVGRLDKDSHGVLLLTDDGDLANRLSHPSFEVEKTYRVRAWGQVEAADLQRLATGIDLEEGRTAPARLENVRIDGKDIRFFITIHEGKKRQIRRMVREIGAHVNDLCRVAYAGLRLGELGKGEWRELKSREVAELKRRIQPKTKEKPGGRGRRRTDRPQG